jgi:hypothetical protein
MGVVKLMLFKPMMRHLKKLFTAEAAFVLGMALLVAGLARPSQNPSLLIAGPVVLLGALACRSARNRADGSVVSTSIRRTFETLALISCALLIFMQKDIRTLIVEDPATNLAIPIWILVAYLLVAKKV